MRKPFITCLCDDTLGAMAKDGLIYRFKLDDIAKLLSQYPSDSDGWFFNASRDRYIAERRGNDVFVNPQFVTENFTDTVYGEECH